MAQRIDTGTLSSRKSADVIVCDSGRNAWGGAALALALVLLGCSTAQISGRRETETAALAKPSMIYVADFELDVHDVRSERTLLPPALPLPGPLGSVLPKLPGTPVDAKERARELVTLMSTSLVDGLTKAGLPARRLSTAESRPPAGWLVRGVFIQVDEGNRIRRAIVGFGAGETQMQLMVAVDDLARGIPKPLYEVVTTADSGKAPGAAPVIAFHPAVAVARVALSGRDLERNVKQTAAVIAGDVAARVQK
jgi:hypothetical protein